MRKGPGADDIRRDIETASGICANFRGKVEAIRRDGTLSAAGHAIQITRLLNGGPTGHLAQLKGHVTKQLQEVRVQREAPASARK